MNVEASTTAEAMGSLDAAQMADWYVRYAQDRLPERRKGAWGHLESAHTHLEAAARLLRA